MLVHIKRIVNRASRGKYAVGAFNTMNMEITQGIVAAASKLEKGVIIQVSESTVRYAGLETIYGIVSSLAKRTKVPVAMHLDHGKDPAIIRDCLKIGFSSVHIDASEGTLRKNIAATRRIVRLGHRHKAWVQGELGSFLGKEGMTRVALRNQRTLADPDSVLTDPGQVAGYVRQTGIDTLAVSVGQIHGSFAGLEKVDLKRLQRIRKQTRIPLVLHGASGLPPSHIRAAIRLGVRIINTDTALRIAFSKKLKAALAGTVRSYDPRKPLGIAREALQAEAEKKIRLYSRS